MSKALATYFATVNDIPDTEFKVEILEDTTDLAKALEMEKKLRKDEFTLEQFLDQMQQVKKLGSLETILGLIPGMGGISQKLKEANVDEKEFDRIEAIIRSMTKKERQKPEIINGSRRKRIAAGCGMRVQDVNKLLKNFEESKKMMKWQNKFLTHVMLGKMP